MAKSTQKKKTSTTSKSTPKKKSKSASNMIVSKSKTKTVSKKAISKPAKTKTASKVKSASTPKKANTKSTKKAAALPKKAAIKKATVSTTPKKKLASKSKQTKSAPKKSLTSSSKKSNTNTKATKQNSASKKQVEQIIPVQTEPQVRKQSKKIVPSVPMPKPNLATLPIDKKPRVKNILISQPFPENGKSPFIDIAHKWKVKVDFRTFIKVEGLTAKEFRRLRININDYSSIIFNSRNAIDYFFKLCEEMRVKLSQDLKYFCTSEAIALYLQKYIHYRKRKVFFDQPGRSLFDLINRFKDTETFLYPCSKDRKDDIPNFLKAKNAKYAEAFIYQTVPSDLSDLRNIKYDLIVFFSPIGIKSLFYNYPDFIQEDRRIGGFGQVTWDAVVDAGLRLDVIAPSPTAVSMAQAIENYLKESNK